MAASFTRFTPVAYSGADNPSGLMRVWVLACYLLLTNGNQSDGWESEMNLKSQLVSLSGAIVLALGLTGISLPAQATGTVILEGSDAIGFHCGIGEVGACTYRDQAWKAIGGPSPLPIAVVGTGTAPIGSGTHAVDDFADLSTAGALSNYAAIYFVAGGGCCDSDPADMGGRQTDVMNYVNGGGTVMIENYDGNSAWDFLFGGSGDYSSAVAGVGGANPASSDNCDDGETVTALGTANGFTQPPPIACWTHQSYEESVFGPLGFTESFFDSPPGMVSGETTGWSSLLSTGSTLSFTSVPEPFTLSLFGAGLAGAVAMRRRKAKGAPKA